MKFKGSGVVWDVEKKKRLCKFVDGRFDTDDKRTIEILQRLGYKTIGAPKKIEKAENGKVTK